MMLTQQSLWVTSSGALDMQHGEEIYQQLMGERLSPLSRDEEVTHQQHCMNAGMATVFLVLTGLLEMNTNTLNNAHMHMQQ